eukprot:m51a1_g5153 hypothetical protein (132) ;mRNA; f:70296-70691
MGCGTSSSSSPSPSSAVSPAQSSPPAKEPPRSGWTTSQPIPSTVPPLALQLARVPSRSCLTPKGPAAAALLSDRTRPQSALRRQGSVRWNRMEEVQTADGSVSQRKMPNDKQREREKELREKEKYLAAVDD